MFLVKVLEISCEAQLDFKKILAQLWLEVFKWKTKKKKIWYLEDVTSTSVHETNFAVTGYLEDSAHWSEIQNLIWKLA